MVQTFLNKRYCTIPHFRDMNDLREIDAPAHQHNEFVHIKAILGFQACPDLHSVFSDGEEIVNDPQLFVGGEKADDPLRCKMSSKRFDGIGIFPGICCKIGAHFFRIPD